MTIAVKMPVATRPGAASGRTIRRNAVNRVSRGSYGEVTGISRKKLSIIQTTIVTLNAA